MVEYNPMGEPDDTPTPQKGQKPDREYDKPDEKAQENEESKNVTPTQPEISPHDTTKDAHVRWDTESPAMKGQPNRIDPEPLNEDISNPDEDGDDMEDPDAHKNVK